MSKPNLPDFSGFLFLLLHTFIRFLCCHKCQKLIFLISPDFYFFFSGLFSIQNFIQELNSFFLLPFPLFLPLAKASLIETSKRAPRNYSCRNSWWTYEEIFREISATLGHGTIASRSRKREAGLYSMLADMISMRSRYITVSKVCKQDNDIRIMKYFQKYTEARI